MTQLAQQADKHIAYMDSRYRYTEEDGTHVYTEERPVFCRSWRNGSMVLCEACEAQAVKDYPQGWNYYPGDRCKHGRYVGGCGADYMCPKCEDGD